MAVPGAGLHVGFVGAGELKLRLWASQHSYEKPLVLLVLNFQGNPTQVVVL